MSSPVRGVGRCGLTLVSLVSEPSSVLPEAWLQITLYDVSYVGFLQFTQFSICHPWQMGPNHQTLVQQRKLWTLYMFSYSFDLTSKPESNTLLN